MFKPEFYVNSAMKENQMMKQEISARWMGEMQFESLVNGHKIMLDSPVQFGGKDAGPTPKPLLLAALAGCTGMDVIAILSRSDRIPESFSLKVIGETAPAAPFEYTSIHLVYNFAGEENCKGIVLEAVNTSEERFCGIGKMLKKFLPITWEIIYNGKQIFSNSADSIL